MCCYTADRLDETLPITDPMANIKGRSAIGCRGASNISKSREDIVNTPLFTYEYKKDRPEKSRMGIISEELPKHLQLKEEKNVGEGKSKKKKTISMPDWPSIYGTFWTGIKALFIQFKSFKEKMFAELKKLKGEFTEALKVAEGNKNTIGKLNVLLEDTAKVSKAHQLESNKRNKELAKLKKLLKETTEELQSVQKEMQEIKKLIKQNKDQSSLISPR